MGAQCLSSGNGPVFGDYGRFWQIGVLREMRAHYQKSDRAQNDDAQSAGVSPDGTISSGYS